MRCKNKLPFLPAKGNLYLAFKALHMKFLLDYVQNMYIFMLF